MSAPPKPDEVASRLNALSLDAAAAAANAGAPVATGAVNSKDAAAASTSATAAPAAAASASSSSSAATATPAAVSSSSSAAAPVTGAAALRSAAASSGMSAADIEKLLATVQAGASQQQKSGDKAADKAAAAAAKEYKFWSTQPVPRIDETPTEHGPIERKSVADVATDPYPLPTSFEWDSIDMTVEANVKEVYSLLYENYVEDDDNMFRFDYSADFLKWALMPPGFRREWHVGVRSSTNKKLVAFISGIPQKMRVYKDIVPMVEINYLCVHKKLRAKRLAPVLIKEITRRVNLRDIWQAVYTAGVVLPKAVAQNRYYHRSLNPKKLIDIGFSRLHRNMTMLRTIKLYKVPDTPQLPGFRPLVAADVPEVTRLLNGYLNKCQLAPVFDEDEVAHWLIPRAGVVDSYVVAEQKANGTQGPITDLCSFYHLPSTVIGHATHNQMKAAYSFYNVPRVPTEERWTQLMGDALVAAKNLNMDVFNALNVMDNERFLKALKFGEGDGHLQYYLYNWRCPTVTPNNVGLVLL